MADNPICAICERIADVQAMHDAHLASAKHSAVPTR
jgi:hypothetical protein